MGARRGRGPSELTRATAAFRFRFEEELARLSMYVKKRNSLETEARSAIQLWERQSTLSKGLLNGVDLQPMVHCKIKSGG